MEAVSTSQTEEDRMTSEQKYVVAGELDLTVETVERMVEDCGWPEVPADFIAWYVEYSEIRG